MLLQKKTKPEQKQKQVPQIKQQESGTQKLLSFIAKLFIGEKGIQAEINRSVVSNTYYSILEIVHTALLFAVFNKSNSAFYSLMQSAIGGFFFLVCLIPRISKKHIIFQITFVLYGLAFIGSGLCLIVLFKYFYIFSFYCTQLLNYYTKRSTASYPSQAICQTVYQMYLSEIIVQVVILGLRVLYLIMCFRAYMIAKQKFDQEQKKKRRRDRYNQLLMKRTMFNQKRKV